MPLRIEVVGVAGSGKSTLTRTLLGRHPEWRLADTLHTRVPGHWPYVVHGAPQLVTLLARTARSRPALSWDEVKFVLYVSEWHRFLRSRREYRSGTILLDQGPVFALARLLWDGKPAARSAVFREWRERMIDSWSQELDAIALLDAPDPTLLDRINRRDQRHDAKGIPGKDALALIGAHRAAYAEVFGSLERRDRPPVLRFDTGELSPDAIADRLSAFLEEHVPRPLTRARTGVNVG